MPKLVHDVAAENDLIEIWIYTDKEWGLLQAEHYLDILERGIEAIAKRPERGKQRNALREGYRSARIEHHIIFYTFDEAEIRIRRVLHEAMDVGRHV